MPPQPINPLSGHEYGPYERLPPLERPAAPVRSIPAAAGQAQAEPSPPAGAYEVRYALDGLRSDWVAQFFDVRTGDYVKSVPTVHVGRSSVDTRA